jgi:glycosyltransferase involved in cell wall biosynthesis
MHIAFIGQLGLPKLLERGFASSETRVAALSRLLAAKGHVVTVLGTKPYLSQGGNDHGVVLRRYPSLNPEKPGGWLYMVCSLWFVGRTQPDVIHAHGWHAGALLPLIERIAPESTIVWTLTSLPRNYFRIAKLITRAAVWIGAEITVPTRWLQYLLLQEFGVRAAYIPDGYTPEILPPVSLSAFKLRRGQYVLALTDTPAATRSVKRAYTKAKLRKKLVFAENYRGRVLRTLIRHAHTVIAAGEPTALDALLQAMDSGKAIVATTAALHQETLGVTAQFYKPGDHTGFAQAFDQTSPALGKAAALRAKHHFPWTRILPEYLTLYHALRRPVLLDSAHPVTFTRAAV